jgi:TP901 family phage tail tape measure protein
MSINARSVAVRYTASVGKLVSDLERAAKANDRLADATDRAATRTQKNAQRTSTANRQIATSSDDAARKSEKNADRMALGGAVVAAGLGLAIAKFAEFDAQMSAVGAATGKTGADLDQLRDAAVRAGADTQYSATEAAAGITELSKAGLDATEILGGGLTGALNLAAAGQLDVADAAETMATALAQFKLGGDRASHVADLLAAGAGKAQGSVSDMAQALKQGGLVADQTGLSIEETVAGLTAFANAGLIGSDSGTAFKSMLQRLTPTSDEAAGLIDELGISAYDAQGNFVGLEKYAGILKEGLKDLTPEQRNAAMATIFGSDAVRAASVLYKEGAEGIAKWTEETNQSGFAAEQAARLTDNLKGDVERLGGALDTALIQGGSGANNVMRTLTQTTEGLVEGLAGIPGPVMAGVAAFGAMALLGPKVGSLAKTVTGPLSEGIQRFRDEMKLQEALATTVGRGYDALGENAIGAGNKVSKASVRMGAAKAAIGGIKGAAGGLISALGGPWGIAMAGATVAVGLWAQKQADAAHAAQVLNSTVDQQTDKFTQASRESVLAAFADALAPEDLKRVQELGVNLGDVTAALLEGGPAAAAMKDKLKGMADERAGIFGSDDARLLEALMNQFDIQAAGADKVRASLELLRNEKNNQIIADSRQAGSAATAERNTADLGVAADGAAGSMQGGADAAGDMGGALNDMGGEAKDAKTELEGLMNFIDANFGSGERAIRANKRSFDADVRDATEAAKEAAKAGTKGYADPDAVKAQTRAREAANKAAKRLKEAKKGGKKDTIASAQEAVKSAAENLADANQRVKDTWHDATKAGEDYQAALEGIAADGQKSVEELIKQNKPIKDVNKAYDDTRDAMTKVLALRGIKGQAAQDEIDDIFATTGAMDDLRWRYANTQAQVATTIETPGLPEAKKGIEGYWTVIDGVPTFVKTTFSAYTADARSAIDVLKGEIAAMPKNHTTTFTIRRIQNEVKLEQNGITSAAGNIVRAYAAGGLDAPNRHVAEIATSGTRMWAEPETQGELYAPLANDWRRPRAKALVSQVVSRFGGDVTWHAAGSMSASAFGAPAAAGSGVTRGEVRTMLHEAAAVFASRMPRPIYSGQDARSAAISEQRKREWEIVNG